VPTNISHEFYPYLLKSRCAYQHFPCFFTLSAEIQVCLPTFPMSLIIACCNPCVPTNISHEFHPYLLKSRCAYQHFPCLFTLSAEILVCLPTFPISFYNCLLKSLCAYQHFSLILSFSAEIQVCLPTFTNFKIQVCLPEFQFFLQVVPTIDFNICIL